jgi:hypothetical protein
VSRCIPVAPGLSVFRVPGFGGRTRRKYADILLIWQVFPTPSCAQRRGTWRPRIQVRRVYSRPLAPSAGQVHLVDHMIPPVPVREWLLSLPKRLRWHQHRDPVLTTAILRLFLRAVEQTLGTHSETVPTGARMGAISFIHRFGASLNPHPHYHCYVTDGVFSGDTTGVHLHTSTPIFYIDRRPLPGRVQPVVHASPVGPHSGPYQKRHRSVGSAVRTASRDPRTARLVCVWCTDASSAT